MGRHHTTGTPNRLWAPHAKVRGRTSAVTHSLDKVPKVGARVVGVAAGYDAITTYLDDGTVTVAHLTPEALEVIGEGTIVFGDVPEEKQATPIRRMSWEEFQNLRRGARVSRTRVASMGAGLVVDMWRKMKASRLGWMIDKEDNGFLGGHWVWSYLEIDDEWLSVQDLRPFVRGQVIGPAKAVLSGAIREYNSHHLTGLTFGQAREEARLVFGRKPLIHVKWDVRPRGPMLEEELGWVRELSDSLRARFGEMD